MTPDDARSCRWLKDLAKPPKGATWPRLMTAPHPRAEGSYGAEVAAWIDARWPWRLAWHQQLILRRAFEHDAAGDLCWREVGLSIARQFFKSSTGGGVCAWRLEQGERFGGPQYVLHVAKDLGIAMDVQRPWRNRAKEDPVTYKVLGAAGRVEINYLPDDSRNVLRSPEGSYGQSADMVFVDEAWGVKAEAVDVTLLPTLMQRPNSQLWMASTANARASGLMLGRRAAALAQLEEPERLLWIEWSAPPGCDVADPAVWRRACPYTDARIEQDLADAFATAVASRTSNPLEPDPVDGFAVQRLNMWPDHVEPVAKRRGEPLVDSDEWTACHEDLDCGGPLVLAVEDNFGQGAALAICGRLDEDRSRFYVEGQLYERRADALERAGAFLEHYQGSRLLVGASLAEDPTAKRLHAALAGQRETTVGLPLLRTLVADRRLVHWNSDEISAQVAEARVTATAVGGGLALVPGTRSDLVRAMTWALHSIEQRPPRVPRIYAPSPELVQLAQRAATQLR